MIYWSSYVLLMIFMLGLYGLIMNSSNLIQLLMCLEMLLLCLLLNFSLYSLLNMNILSLIVSFLMTVIAASESALGLTMMVLFYKMSGSISAKNLILLKNKWLTLIFLTSF